ncbi:NUDIX hydrolase [Aeromicrobium sp. YIM 150415]|uniref:NUDIX hydrolase n=1 Tax=Aeromicrobium sp. YIM 150415 TaxID=2803912 RepID=UPI00196414F1|nr:NUDIX hydrolase [Aeromicrobium sp. YIM 150415]MBM9462912.1 NUDIX hydrolase [Aeromicrobium sp. YIM 150415]
MTDEALRDGELSLEPTSGSAEFHGFAVLIDEERVGTVALRPDGRREGSIRWNLGDHGSFAASRALRLGIQHAFTELGWERVWAQVDVDDTTDLRSASLAGLRREGVTRRSGAPDRVLVGRLIDDPPALSREGFVSILNAGLPRKRVIAQGLLRDEHDRVLLCELTYKREWDLPGGVIEVGESPGTGLVRELHEELGITVDLGALVTMNWLPPWREWDDACLFVFDLGRIDAATVEDMELQRTEIAGVHWCDLEEARAHATGATVELLEALEAGELPAYREAPLQPE